VKLGGVFWKKLELSLNKIRLPILNNRAQRFPILFPFCGTTGEQKFIGGDYTQIPFSFCPLAFWLCQKFFRRRRAIIILTS